MKLTIKKITYVLLTSVLSMLFFYSRSVDTYWQQAYHRPSPLSWLNSYAWFQSGANLTEYITEKERQFLTLFHEWNSSFIDNINLHYINVPIKEITNITNITDDVEPRNNLKSKENNELIVVESTIVETTVIGEVSSTTVDDQVVKSELLSTETEILNSSTTETELQEALTNNPDSKLITITPQDKLLFIGDSLMQGVAPRVKRALFQQHKIESIDLSKQSTGLTYPGYFNWPKTVQEMLAGDPEIKVLVVFLGPNDPWDFPIKGRSSYVKFKSKLWENIYRQRINLILDTAQEYNVQVLWLSVPCMRKPKLQDDMIYLNNIYRSEVENKQYHYLETSPLLGCSDEKYHNFVLTEKGSTKVRIDDGIHFTVPGQRILANAISSLLSIKSAVEETLPVSEHHDKSENNE